MKNNNMVSKEEWVQIYRRMFENLVDAQIFLRNESEFSFRKNLALDNAESAVESWECIGMQYDFIKSEADLYIQLLSGDGRKVILNYFSAKKELAPDVEQAEVTIALVESNLKYDASILRKLEEPLYQEFKKELLAA